MVGISSGRRRSEAPIRRLRSSPSRTLPMASYLTIVKSSTVCIFLLSCVYFAFSFNNKSMFHRLLLRWHVYFFPAQLRRLLVRLSSRLALEKQTTRETPAAPRGSPKHPRLKQTRPDLCYQPSGFDTFHPSSSGFTCCL